MKTLTWLAAPRAAARTNWGTSPQLAARLLWEATYFRSGDVRPLLGRDHLALLEAGDYLLRRAVVGLAGLAVADDRVHEALQRAAQALGLRTAQGEAEARGALAAVVEARDRHGVGVGVDAGITLLAKGVADREQRVHHRLHRATRAQLRDDPGVVEGGVAADERADARAADHVVGDVAVRLDLLGEAAQVGQATVLRAVTHALGDGRLRTHEVRRGQVQVPERLEEGPDRRVGGLDRAQPQGRDAEGLVPGRQGDDATRAERQDRHRAQRLVEEAVLFVHHHHEPLVPVTPPFGELGESLHFLEGLPAEAGRVALAFQPQHRGGLRDQLVPLLPGLRLAVLVAPVERDLAAAASVGDRHGEAVDPVRLNEADLVARVGEVEDAVAAGVEAARRQQDVLAVVVVAGDHAEPVRVGAQQVPVPAGVARVVLVVARRRDHAVVEHLGRQRFVLAHTERQPRDVDTLPERELRALVDGGAQHAEGGLVQHDRPGALRELEGAAGRERLEATLRRGVHAAQREHVRARQVEGRDAVGLFDGGRGVGHVSRLLVGVQSLRGGVAHGSVSPFHAFGVRDSQLARVLEQWHLKTGKFVPVYPRFQSKGR